MPPFSVLDARQGYWQERKRFWLAKGIKSEIGRGGVGIDMHTDAATISRQNGEIGFDGSKKYKNGLLGFSEQARSHYKNASPGGSPRHACDYSHRERGDGAGRPIGNRLTWVTGNRPDDELDEVSRKNLAAQPQSDTSIFDPVLCELIYRWFTPPGGHVLDPFAGGSVRGIVAALTGFQYTGVDLRPEQIAANKDQWDFIGLKCPPSDNGNGTHPRWIAGDSQDIAAIAPGRYDLIFSCPPYFDLERYSDDPRDLSNMDYEGFLKTYRGIVAASVGMLKPDRFACFVVGDIRDRRGFYRNFVGDTIEAFQDAGAILYNEAVLITSVGSLPIRVNKQFQGYRKLGKTHQNVLVFYKGDPKNIKSIYGDVDTGLKNHEQESLFSFGAPATLEDFG